jgi:hypothetical protein
MTRHKGARTDKHREAEYPFVVDIPIGGDGLGQSLNLIVAIAAAAGGEQWGHRTKLDDGKPQYWCRMGARTETDAASFVRQFSHLGARRIR